MNVNSSSLIPEIFTCSLQVVLLITDIIILGVFLFFKMYHKFLYRLLLYAVVAGIISLTTKFAYLYINIQNHHVEFGTNIINDTFITVLWYVQYTSASSAYLLLTSMGLCIYLLAIHHHQFTSWMADLIFLFACLIFSQPMSIAIIVLLHLHHQPPVHLTLLLAINFILIFLANVGFTALTLVPMYVELVVITCA